MKYLVQMHTGNEVPLTKVEWHSDKNWDRVKTKEYNDEERAVYRLKYDADLSRMVWPLRVITSEGQFIIGYDPELDTRLPGCRWRIIQRNAYHLWEAAGKPDGDGTDFWHQAEQELKKHNGIVIGDKKYD